MQKWKEGLYREREVLQGEGWLAKGRGEEKDVSGWRVGGCERGRRVAEMQRRAGEREIRVAEGKKGGRGAKRLAEGLQRGKKG